MAREFKLGRGVPVEQLELYLNEKVPKDHPGYEVFQVLVVTQQMEAPKIAVGPQGPIMVQVGFPLLYRDVD